MYFVPLNMAKTSMPPDERAALWFNGLVALAAVVGMFVAIVQTCAIRQTNKLATDALAETRTAVKASVHANELSLQTTKLDRRAWLGLSAANIGELAPASKAMVTVRIKNSGPTPARHVVSVLMVRFMPAAARCLPSWKDQSISKTSTSTSVIFSGDGTTLVAEQQDVVNATRAAEMKNGATHLCVNVLISYRDIFDESHETEVCGFVYKAPNASALSVVPLDEACNHAT